MKTVEDISNMEISNPFGHTKISNRFLIHEEDAYPLLQAIYNGTAPYTSDAYSVLTNSMERFYKGILYELKKMYPTKVIIPNDINGTHRFTHVIAQINRYIPVSKYKEGVCTIIRNCDQITEGYTKSRYYEIYEKKDFDLDFQRFMIQRERLFRLLDSERMKFEAKEAMATDYAADADREDDFEYWG